MLIARGKRFELPGTWAPPPGNALEHHTARFAKMLYSAVFLTGLEPRDAAANVGFFTGPLQYRSAVVDTVVDRSRKEVRLRLASGVTGMAQVFGGGNFLDQGYEMGAGATGRGSATCTCRTGSGTASGCCRRAM